MAASRIVHRVCTLCEATCGIRVHVEGDSVTTIRGDQDDPFSRGYICPKAYGLKGLYEDRDRLRAPLVRTSSGFEAVSWERAFEVAIDGLLAVRERHGSDGVGSYAGNPTVHSLQAMLYLSVFLRALGTKQRFSASSVDQLPKMVSSGLMFGSGLNIAVPDLDRTQYLLVLGGNPAVSNGSLMTAPDAAGRLRAIAARGGKVVVFDPRRTETAQLAAEHHFLQPGTDAALLLAMVQVMFEEKLVRLGRASGHVRGLDAVKNAVGAFTPERVAAYCRIEPAVIRRLTREFCEAPSAVCYGRLGTTCQTFGTVASWAVDLVNVLSGNLDAPGGAMFSRPAIDNSGGSRYTTRARGGPTRVKGLPRWFGEAPVATLADEILTEGPGQIRGLFTFAGNPLLSAPDSNRLEQAFRSLEFMVSVDVYLNETTRHAHVILPPPTGLERDHYDLALYRFAVRDVAKYSQPVFAPPQGQPEEWEILLTLAKAMWGQRALSLEQADEIVFTGAVKEAHESLAASFPDLTLEEIKRALPTRRGAPRVLDVLLRSGPYGDAFGRNPDGLTLAQLESTPHGRDLGALKPQLPQALHTSDRMIDLAPELLIADVARLEVDIARQLPELVLIGRRQLRSNNSWMHNIEALIKGPQRCTLLVNEQDAARRGLRHGQPARLSSAVGSIVAQVEVTADMMPGVVSLPHGFGHSSAGAQLGVAALHAGVNINVVSDSAIVDPVSGNAAFNGVEVTLEPVA